jgi:hypothetical protein
VAPDVDHDVVCTCHWTSVGYPANLALGEPLALVQELHCFDELIKMDPLLLSSLDLSVHNMIIGCLLYAVGVELCWCQLFCYF